MEKKDSKQSIRMTAEQHEKAIEWMVTNASNFKCELCQNEKFDILTDFTFHPLIGQDGSPVDSTHFIPSFIVICLKCGNTKFINAMKSNVMLRNEVNSQIVNSAAEKTPQQAQDQVVK